MSSKIVFHLSKCKGCGQGIVWDELNGRKLPFDPIGSESNGYRPSNITHFKTCPERLKKEAQEKCPACIIRREGLKALIDKPRCIYGDFCKVHQEAGKFIIDFFGIQRTVPLDYKELQRLRRDIKAKVERATEAGKSYDLHGGGLDLWS